MLTLSERILLENKSFDYIFEAIGGEELKKKLKVEKISAKDAGDLLMSDEFGGGKQFNTEISMDEQFLFNEVDHYVFKFNDDILGVIGLSNFSKALDKFYSNKSNRRLSIYEVIFEIPLAFMNNIELKGRYDPIMELHSDKEQNNENMKELKKLIENSLYVCELQIRKEIVAKNDIGAIAPLMLIFDWVKNYSNDKFILTGGKDARTTKMYAKIGKFWNIDVANDETSKKVRKYIDTVYDNKLLKDTKELMHSTLKDSICILKK